MITAGEGKLLEIEYIDDKTIFGSFYITKTDKLEQDPIFGFLFADIPIQDIDEFEKLFDQILSTFTFLPED